MQTPWTLFATSEHNSAMQDFTDLTYITIPQHKDSTEACNKGDSSDLEEMKTHNNLFTIHSWPYFKKKRISAQQYIQIN